MRWRASAIVQPIEDLATARALVVGGALAMAFDAGLTALLGLFVHPVFVIVGLIGCGLAAGIWFANSRAAAIISCIIAILGTLTNLATLDPLAIMRSIVITVFVIGAVRGTFAWHGRQRSAPAPVAANQFA
jgi:ABC-type protease/lipase transport system fused ATPase/permease subunit